MEVYSQAGSARVLNNAVRYGLLKPSCDRLFRKVAGSLLLNEIATKDPDLQAPYQNPKSQVYFEHHYDAILQPDPDPNLLEWTVELARFPVPVGSVGMLRRLEQYVWNGTQTITQSANWGIPYQEDNLGAVRWYLRLMPYTGAMPPRYAAVGTSWLPNMPFNGLPQIDHIWFPATSPGAEINALIPGGFCLRFFFYAPAGIPNQVRVMGRLRGWYQSIYCRESGWNARCNW